MSINELIPPLVAIVVIVFVLFIAFGQHRPLKGSWLIAAIVSAVFFAFSLYTVVSEGPFGFWAEHVRYNWGNQIWLCLLLAASIGWYLIVLQVKAL